MQLREDIQEFIEVIENRNHDVEIETYNYTIMKGELFDDINDFGLYLSKNINHEIMLDNLVINNHVIENKLSYKDLALLLDNDDPHLVNIIMKYNGVSVERAVEILENSFIVETRNELEAFREWFETYQSHIYNKIMEMQIVPGITDMEVHVDWEKVCRDYKLSSIIEILNVDDTYIIY